MNKKTKIFVLSLVPVFILGLIFAGNKRADVFPNDISKCNSTETRLRFSCYRSTIERYYHNNLTGLVNRLKDDKGLVLDSTAKGDEVSYAIFGTNCHTFYHAVGDFIAETAPNNDIKTNLDYCSSTCTAGCTMGLYKRTALENNFDTALLKKFYNICRENERNQCTHEIGHLLHDKYFYSILKVLDNISYQEYGLKQPKEYKYVTEATNDLNAPFEECKEIVPENKLAQCFTGIGHNLFLFSEFAGSYKPILDECTKIPDTNKDNCFAFLIYRIGINEAATKFLSNKFADGNKVCDDVVALINRKDLKSHCYLGVGGGLGLFMDSEYGSAKIDENSAPQVKERLTNTLKLCDNAEKGFKDYCLRGLWGTGFKKLYKNLNLYDEDLEKLIPELDNDFEVVG